MTSFIPKDTMPYANPIQMGHCNHLASMRNKWCSWFCRIWIMGLLMFANVTSEDQIGAPSSGSLCISDCATCPVICSPPPPLLESFPPPSPPVHHSPPKYYYSNPPPPPSLPSSPPASPPKSSSYPSWGTPPPPFKYYNNMPPSGRMPPMAGPNDYPYPYYYFYASKAASSLPLDAPFYFMLLFFFHCVFYFW
nr:extensin-1-like [Quercus suber]